MTNALQILHILKKQKKKASDLHKLFCLMPAVKKNIHIEPNTFKKLNIKKLSGIFDLCSNSMKSKVFRELSHQMEKSNVSLPVS